MFFFNLGHSESLGEADPQLSAPSRIVRFQDESNQKVFEETEAEDRMDSEETSGIDPALLQAVLADPVLLQAVDHQILQAILVIGHSKYSFPSSNTSNNFCSSFSSHA